MSDYDTEDPTRLLWLNEHTAEAILETLSRTVEVRIQDIGGEAAAWFVKVGGQLIRSGKGGSRMVAEFDATNAAQAAAIDMIRQGHPLARAD